MHTQITTESTCIVLPTKLIIIKKMTCRLPLLLLKQYAANLKQINIFFLSFCETKKLFFIIYTFYNVFFILCSSVRKRKKNTNMYKRI